MYTEKKTIFIDGSSGTAGLRIYDLLAQRADAVVRVFCGIPVYLKGAPNT